MNRIQQAATRLAALCLVSLPAIGAAPDQQIGFSDNGWQVSGETKVEEYLGYESMRIRSGRAIRPEVRFEDGTIEFDLAVTPYRSFVYLQFRMQSDTEYEELYFRPHKSGLPDAIQYCPVYKGASNWQLYHGPGFTAAADFPPYRWIRVRVVLSQERAAVFVGEVEEPQMVVPRLARGKGAGYVALRGFLPQDKPGGIYSVSYANLTLRPGVVPYRFSAVTEERSKGVVTEWSLSQSFDPGPGAIQQMPDAHSDQWVTVPSEPSGLVVIGRHRALPHGVRRAAVLAKLTIRSEAEETRQFNFGYSDEVSVFLNGRLLFSGDDSYSFNFPRRDGLIGLDQGTLYLPLKAGENELVLAVTDGFGGWGVMGQIEDREGLEVMAGSKGR